MIHFASLTQGALRDPGLWSLTASRLSNAPINTQRHIRFLNTAVPCRIDRRAVSASRRLKLHPAIAEQIRTQAAGLVVVKGILTADPQCHEDLVVGRQGDGGHLANAD